MPIRERLLLLLFLTTLLAQLLPPPALAAPLQIRAPPLPQLISHRVRTESISLLSSRSREQNLSESTAKLSGVYKTNPLTHLSDNHYKSTISSTTQLSHNHINNLQHSQRPSCGVPLCHRMYRAALIMACETRRGCIAVKCMAPSGQGIVCLSESVAHHLWERGSTYHANALGMGLQSDQIAPWLPVPFHSEG